RLANDVADCWRRPHDMFAWTDLPSPVYPGIWQCVGMIVGVYGIGYAIAASNPLRHWPIVLVGFLGKILGPIGMLQNVFFLPADAPGRLPASWLWLNLTNDVIWLAPFAMILYATFRRFNQPQGADSSMSILAANKSAITQHDVSLHALNAQQPVLLVFLRHSGCTFCRQMINDIVGHRKTIEAHATIALVHMGMENAANRAFFDGHGAGDLHRISDPNAQLYRAYELPRGRFGQLFGWTVWWRGFQAAILQRHWLGKLEGDGFQMSGVFLVHQDRVIRGEHHQTAADRTDYCQLAMAKT
ncbi:MAG: SelL-related redox protein, partial [Planctomycetota bacterium]